MKIIYEPIAAEKIRTWSLHAGLDAEGKGTLTEVGGLGTVRIEKPDTFVVTDSFLLEDQVAGAADYVASAAAVAKFYEEFILGGGDPATVLSFWHSHANMGVFQSGTDRSNVKDTFSKKACCVAVTWNAKGEVYGEVTLFKPIEMRFDKVPVEIAWPYNPAHLAELREKVKPKAAVVQRSIVEDWTDARWTQGREGWYRNGQLVTPQYAGRTSHINTPSSIQAEHEAIARSGPAETLMGNALRSETLSHWTDLAEKNITWDWREGAWHQISEPFVFEAPKMTKRERKDVKKKHSEGQLDVMIGSYGDEDPIAVVCNGVPMMLFSYMREACLGNKDSWFVLEALEERCLALTVMRRVFANKMAKKKYHGWAPIGEGRKVDSFPDMVAWSNEVDSVVGVDTPDSDDDGWTARNWLI
jgi:hypothetical protein